MKIVRVINSLHNGGVQLRLERVARDLAARGHDVSIVCTAEEGPNAPRVRDSGVRVEVVPVAKWKSPRAWWRLAAHLRRERPDVVHSHMFRQNAPATIAARLAGVRKVYAQVHLVNTYKNRGWVRTDRVLSRLRTAMLAVSEGVAKDIRDALHPFPPPRLRVLYNGVDLSPFAGLDRAKCRTDLRAGLRLPDDAFLVVNLARLHPEKNQGQLLDVFARVVADSPRAHLLLAGEGEARADLESHTRRLGISDNVVFAGQRGDVPALLAGCDAFVLPSIQEGFSNAILEAMAAGLPVIASDTGGAREVVRDGENGWVVAVRHPAPLEEKLRALVHDPGQARAMGQAGLRIVRDFSHDAMIENTLRLYSD